jgi:hypothetical protein
MDGWAEHETGDAFVGADHEEWYSNNGWPGQGHGRWNEGMITEDFELGSGSIGEGIKHVRTLVDLTGAGSGHKQSWGLRGVEDHDSVSNGPIHGKIRSHGTGFDGSNHDKWHKFNGHEEMFITKTKGSGGRYEGKGHFREDKWRGARTLPHNQRYVVHRAGDWDVNSQLAVTAENLPRSEGLGWRVVRGIDTGSL